MYIVNGPLQTLFPVHDSSCIILNICKVFFTPPPPPYTCTI
jgi:hypothetical protein